MKTVACLICYNLNTLEPIIILGRLLYPNSSIASKHASPSTVPHGYLLNFAIDLDSRKWRVTRWEALSSYVSKHVM